MTLLKRKVIDEVEALDDLESEDAPFEIIVKYRASESVTVDTHHGYTGKVSTTKDAHELADASTHTLETVYPDKARNVPKTMSYPCYSYSVTEGALFIGSDPNSKAGFFVPLDVILEVEFVDNRTAEEIQQANVAAAQAAQQ